MSNRLITLLLILSTIAVLSGCSTVAVSGRKQLNIIPDSQINAMSFQQYDEFLQQSQLSSNTAQVNMVKTVGTKIQHAVERYFAEKGKSKELKDYRWEFNLVEDSQINAWCMPGGKVVVYTGIMPVAKNEAGLATVMGHEIAHAIAKHGNERMSQGLLVQAGALGLGMILDGESEETQTAFMAAYGAGAQVGVLLPFSRKHESEADHLGLIFMAMAGYNPNEAVNFWQRMSSLGGEKPPEFLSTHPSDQRRIQDIQKLIPEAMKYYQGH